MVKGFSLNLNQYRNAHFYKLNNAKVEYKAVMRSQIELLPELPIIRLTYVVYPKTSREFDISNVCSIVDKFFSDALVELGKLPDDNFKYLPEVVYKFGEKDKDNPRVEIIIETLESSIDTI